MTTTADTTAAAGLTRGEILAVASNLFPRWREDIQEQFVLRLARGVLAADQARAALAQAVAPAPAAVGEPNDMLWCETCEGGGTIDESLGGDSFSNPKTPCPDCDGKGWWRRESNPAAPPAQAVQPEPSKELESLRVEVEELDALRDKLAGILSRTAIALRGPEPALTRWSWHDLPELAAAAVAAARQAQAAQPD